MTPRKLVGRANTLTLREKIYELPDGLEVETNEQYEVTRKRVFFNDVRLVTFHREKGWAFIVFNLLFTLMWWAIGVWSYMLSKSGTGLLILVVVGTPTFIAAVLRLILGVDVVTVFGRRSKAAARFAFRKAKARALYEHLCATVASVQQALAEEYAREETPATPAPEYEMPPSPSSS